MNDWALSTGLEPTDAQADYSAFSGHMTRDLHVSQWRWRKPSNMVLFRVIGGLYPPQLGVERNTVHLVVFSMCMNIYILRNFVLHFH